MLWKILMSLHISISSVDQHRRVPIHQLCSLVSMGTTDPYLCWGLKQNGSYFHTSTTVLPENVRGNAEQKDRKGWILWMRGEEEVVYSFFFLFLSKFESGKKRKGRLNECVCECERQRHSIWRIKRRKSPNFFFSDDFFEHGPYCSGPMGADWSKKEIVITIKKS